MYRSTIILVISTLFAFSAVAAPIADPNASTIAPLAVRDPQGYGYDGRNDGMDS